MKEHERREYLKTLDEEKRKREESKFEEMKKKHGDHPKVHHPVRPQTVFTWLGGSFPFQREIANKQRSVSCLFSAFASSHRHGSEVWEQCWERYKPHYIYPHSFCTSMLCADRITIYKEASDEARTVFKPVGMASWYGQPASSCITVPFALERHTNWTSFACYFWMSHYRCPFPEDVQFPWRSLFP